MKKSSIRVLLVLAVLFTASFTASAQIYVKIRPPMPVIIKPPRPSQLHIWVEEDWKQDGNSYRYSGGHWVSPPKRGHRWIPGRWHRSPHGERWVPGRWKGNGKKH